MRNFGFAFMVGLLAFSSSALAEKNSPPPHVLVGAANSFFNLTIVQKERRGNQGNQDNQGNQGDKGDKGDKGDHHGECEQHGNHQGQCPGSDE